MVLAFWFLFALLAMVLSRRQLDRRIQRLAYLITRSQRGSLLAFVLFYLPGVLLHELSHWTAARMLFVETQGISLLPRPGPEGRVQLGHVKVRRIDPLRASLIGLAPLFAGGGILVWALWPQLGAGDLGSALQSLDWRLVREIIQGVSQERKTALWIYLSLAVGNRMLPSRSDRSAWIGFAAAALSIGLLLSVLGLGETAAGAISEIISNLAAALAAILGGVAALNTLLLLPLRLIEVAIVWMIGEP